MVEQFDKYGGYIIPGLAFAVGVSAMIVGRYTDFWSDRVVNNGARIFCVVILLVALPVAIIIEKVLFVDMQPNGEKYLLQFHLPGPKESELAQKETELRNQLIKTTEPGVDAKTRLGRIEKMTAEELAQHRKVQEAQEQTRRELRAQIDRLRQERKNEEASRMVAKEAARPDAARREKNRRIRESQLGAGIVCFAMAWAGSWLFGRTADKVIVPNETTDSQPKASPSPEQQNQPIDRNAFDATNRSP